MRFSKKHYRIRRAHSDYLGEILLFDRYKHIRTSRKMTRLGTYFFSPGKKERQTWVAWSREKHFVAKCMYFSRRVQPSSFRADSVLLRLERRVDTFLFRTGLFVTFSSARQAVSHGKVWVNEFRCRKPGYLLRAGDYVHCHLGPTMSDFLRMSLEKVRVSSRFLNCPRYIEFDYSTMCGILLYSPHPSEVPIASPLKTIWSALST